ncbi:hypothetical protein RB195_014584 [Necator americanus]
MLKITDNYEKDIQERCTTATSTFSSLTKCLCSTPNASEVKLRVYLFAVRAIMMYGSEMVETETKPVRRLLGCVWPRVCQNEDLYEEIDVVYLRKAHGSYQHSY